MTHLTAIPTFCSRPSNIHVENANPWITLQWHIPTRLALECTPHSYVYRGKIFEHAPKSVRHLRIDDVVLEVPNLLFVNYVSLVSVELPLGLRCIGDMAFWSCKSPLRVTVPVSVTSIGRKAFAEFRNLLSAGLPQGLQILGESAFAKRH